MAGKWVLGGDWERDPLVPKSLGWVQVGPLPPGVLKRTLIGKLVSSLQLSFPLLGSLPGITVQFGRNTAAMVDLTNGKNAPLGDRIIGRALPSGWHPRDLQLPGSAQARL